MFVEIEGVITNFIQNTLPSYLLEAGVTDFDRYVNDFIDLEKYKDKKICFYNFGSYQISPLTNESESGAFSFDVFLVFRGETSETLKTKMLKYADAFYAMHKEHGFNFDGAVDGVMDTEVYFFNAAQGNPGVKICQFTFTTTSEM